jgi:hypothetical protein
MDALTTMLDIVESRIPSTGRKDMSLTDYIANLIQMNIIYASSIGDDSSYENRISMYAYLRDEIGCETYGEAMGAIRRREVDPIVMGVWVDEGFINYGELQNIVLEGYPEFKDVFEGQWQDFCDTFPDCDISRY